MARLKEPGWESKDWQDAIRGEHRVMIPFLKFRLKNTNHLKEAKIKVNRQ